MTNISGQRGLFVVGVLSACLFSLAVNYTVNLFVMIARVILFYMDWKLDKHGKASFSKWWVLRQSILLNVVKPLSGKNAVAGLAWDMGCIWHRELCIQQ
jgi:hypothetical protein